MKTPFLIVMLAGAMLVGCTTVHVVENGNYTLSRHLSHWDVALDRSLDDAYEATLDGLRSLDIANVEHRRDQLTGRIWGRLADDREVVVGLESTGERTTAMTIRVGDVSAEEIVTRVFRAIADEF